MGVCVMKRVVAVLLTMALSLSMFTMVSGTAGSGEVFTGSAIGHGGTMTVEVVVNNGDIVSIDVVSHDETFMFYERAFDRVITSVLEDGNLNVDIVTGATLSFMAVRMAIMQALDAAGIDTRAMMIPAPAHTPQTIELEADLVIVGGGGAGLAAAVTAAEMGASSIVIEKQSMLGGNTIIAGGAINIVNPAFQEPLGIEDSIGLHFQHTFYGGGAIANRELVRIMVENALDGFHWLMDDLGLEFRPTVSAAVGALFPRSHTPVMPIGTGYIYVFERFIDRPDADIEVLLDTRAHEFIMEDGRVVGVLATGRNGDEYIIRANNGVINAAGGFGANVEMRLHYCELWDGRLDNNIPTTNFPSIVGDGIVMAQAIGADVVDMGYVQLLPIGDPQTGSLSGTVSIMVEHYIQVNEQGERFIREDGRRDDIIAALFAQSNSTNYLILDSRNWPTGAETGTFGESIDNLVYYGRVHRADTIAELAVMVGMDPDVLQKTVDDFNAMVDGDMDCPFGRTVFGERIEVAPFLANRRVPSVHHTMGGVVIDRYARVIGVDGNIIPGFYAAGEVTGGIHGQNRLGANALTDIIVFGRIAGESAVLGR